MAKKENYAKYAYDTIKRTNEERENRIKGKSYDYSGSNLYDSKNLSGDTSKYLNSLFSKNAVEDEQIRRDAEDARAALAYSFGNSADQSYKSDLSLSQMRYDDNKRKEQAIEEARRIEQDSRAKNYYNPYLRADSSYKAKLAEQNLKYDRAKKQKAELEEIKEKARLKGQNAPPYRSLPVGDAGVPKRISEQNDIALSRLDAQNEAYDGTKYSGYSFNQTENLEPGAQGALALNLNKLNLQYESTLSSVQSQDWQKSAKRRRDQNNFQHGNYYDYAETDAQYLRNQAKLRDAELNSVKQSEESEKTTKQLKDTLYEIKPLNLGSDYKKYDDILQSVATNGGNATAEQTKQVKEALNDIYVYQKVTEGGIYGEEEKQKLAMLEAYALELQKISLEGTANKVWQGLSGMLTTLVSAPAYFVETLANSFTNIRNNPELRAAEDAIAEYKRGVDPSSFTNADEAKAYTDGLNRLYAQRDALAEGNTPVSPDSFGSKLIERTVAQKYNATKDLAPTAQFLANTAMSIGESVAAIAFTGGSAAAPYLMATSGGGSAAYDAVQRGATGTQAAQTAVAGSVAEFLGESVSFGGLRRIATLPRANANSVIKSLFKQGVTEATEEMTTEAANIITDMAIMKDSAQMAQYLQAYARENPEAATNQQLWAGSSYVVKRLAEAGLGGLISGGVMGGGAQGINYIANATITPTSPTTPSAPPVNPITAQAEQAAPVNAEQAKFEAQTVQLEDNVRALKETASDLNVPAEVVERIAPQLALPAPKITSVQDGVEVIYLPPQGLSDGDKAFIQKFNDDLMKAQSHIDRRTMEYVNDKTANAFYEDFPDVRNYIAEGAASLKGDIESGVKGGRFYTPLETAAYYDPDAQNQFGTWGGVKRGQAEPVIRLLDEYGMSYDAINKSLDRIMSGAKHSTVTDRRVELVIDDILSNGYKDAIGMEIPPNSGYVFLKASLPGAAKSNTILTTQNEIADVYNLRKSAFDHMVEYENIRDLAIAELEANGGKPRLTPEVDYIDNVLMRPAERPFALFPEEFKRAKLKNDPDLLNAPEAINLMNDFLSAYETDQASKAKLEQVQAQEDANVAAAQKAYRQAVLQKNALKQSGANKQRSLQALKQCNATLDALNRAKNAREGTIAGYKAQRENTQATLLKEQSKVNEIVSKHLEASRKQTLTQVVAGTLPVQAAGDFTTAYTTQGEQFESQYILVDASDLTPSATQITPPNDLPTVGLDGKIEGGTATAQEVQRMYAQSPAQAQEYRDTLMQKAKDVGIDPTNAGANPIIARVRTSDIDTGKYKTQQAPINSIGAANAAGTITLDDGALGTASTDELVARYGAMDQGNFAQRDIQIPQMMGENEYTGQTTRTLLESGILPDDIANIAREALPELAVWHRKEGFSEPLQNAQKLVDNDIKQAESELYASITKEHPSTKTTALAVKLLEKYVANNDLDSILNMVTDMTQRGTELGRALNAQKMFMTMIKKMGTPGRIVEIQQIEKMLNRTYEKNLNGTQVTANTDLLDELKSATTDEQRTEVKDRIITDMVNQLPTTFGEKVSSWLYMSMLSSPKTHMRNILGNAVQYSARAIKDTLGTGLEGVAGATGILQGDKTKSVYNRFGGEGKKYVDFAKSYFDENKDTLRGSDSLLRNKFEQERKIFKTKPIEGFRKFVMNTLEAEDIFFLKSSYVDSMAGYLKSNKIDLDNATSEQLQKASNHALTEAEKATFRDASKVADALNKFEQTNIATRIIGQGIIPFKRTPINVLKRTVEYSPVGILQGVATAIKDKGVNAQAIDKISAGLTGTSALVLGAFLASKGLLAGSDKDEPEKKSQFDKSVGDRNYSFSLGDYNIGAEPLGAPAFSMLVGAELYRLAQQEGLSFSDTIDAATGLTDPLVEMSMMKGINTLVGTSAYKGSNPIVGMALTAAGNVAEQFVPAIVNSAANTFDENLRSNYTNLGNDLSGSIDKAGMRVTSKIPGARNTLEAQIDLWGRTLENYAVGGNNLGGRAAQNYVNPFNVSKADMDEVEKEVDRLYTALDNDTSVLPDYTETTFAYAGQSYTASKSEKTMLDITRGTMQRQVLEGMIDTPAYKSLTDSQKGKAVSYAYEFASQKAKEELLAGRGVKYENSTFDKTLEGIEKLDPAVYFASKAALNDIKGIPGEDTKSLPYSVKAGQVNYIRENFPEPEVQQQIFDTFDIKADAKAMNAVGVPVNVNDTMTYLQKDLTIIPDGNQDKFNALSKANIAFDQSKDLFRATDTISAKKDAKGNSIPGSKKQQIAYAVREWGKAYGLSREQIEYTFAQFYPPPESNPRQSVYDKFAK